MDKRVIKLAICWVVSLCLTAYLTTDFIFYVISKQEVKEYVVVNECELLSLQYRKEVGMTDIKDSDRCKKCDRLKPDCTCTKKLTNPLWEAVEEIDFSEDWKLDDFVAELEKKVNEE